MLGVEVVVDPDEHVRAIGAIGLRDEAGSEVDDRLLAVTGRRHVAVGAAERRLELVARIVLHAGLEASHVVLPLVVRRLQHQVVERAVFGVELVLVEREVAVGVGRAGVVVGHGRQAVAVHVDLHVVASTAQL